MFINIDPRPAKEMQLLIKLYKAGAPLMVHLRCRDQADPKSGLMNPDAVLYILSQSGQDKTANAFPYLPGDSHIEASGMELSDVFLVAPNATSGKW